MGTILLISLLSCLFYKDFFIGLCLFIYRPIRVDQLEVGLQLKGMRQKPPTVYLSTKASPHCFCFKYNFGSALFVSKDIWIELSTDERDSMVTWSYTASQRYPLVSRLLGLGKMELIDRNSLHWGANSLTLISLLEKLSHFKLKTFSNLGPLRDSERLYPERFQNRINAISREASKLKELS